MKKRICIHIYAYYLVCRWWIIHPEQPTRSIGLNMTFLAVERCFDIVSIFSCPDGKCQKLKDYSDYDLQRKKKLSKTLKYFGNNVECNSLHVNTNELRIRFTSDASLVEQSEISAAPKYKGFSAVYWS
jgi:hypothetical protein